jgi:hypothetical protein
MSLYLCHPRAVNGYAEDIRPFGGFADEIVIQDEAFCSAVTESLRRIEVGR